MSRPPPFPHNQTQTSQPPTCLPTHPLTHSVVVPCAVQLERQFRPNNVYRYSSAGRNQPQPLVIQRGTNSATTRNTRGQLAMQQLAVRGIGSSSTVMSMYTEAQAMQYRDVINRKVNREFEAKWGYVTL